MLVDLMNQIFDSKTFKQTIIDKLKGGCLKRIPDNLKIEEKKDEKLTLTEEQSSLLRKAEIDGSIKVKEFENEVWVTPLLWDVCSYQAKTNLAYFCAIRCGNAQSSTNYSCTVYNNMTGKKLAKWDEFWGFEMED